MNSITYEISRGTKAVLLALSFMIILLATCNTPALATTYYPTSISQANSMGKVGDSLVFKSGTYTGVLSPRSGLNYYGINAIISNPGSKNGASIYFYYLSNISFEGFTIQDGNDYAIFVEGGSGNVIKNCYLSAVGTGVEFTSPKNKVLNCYIHDLRMIVNTPGGTDDYGANGVVLAAPNCTVTGNYFLNCRAQSYDFGYDGGAVEIFGDPNNVDSAIITNNVAMNCEGFAEFGSKNVRHANGVIITGNTLINNGRIDWVNTSGTYQIITNGLTISGNTIYENVQGRYSNVSNVPIGKNSYYITTSLKY